MNTSITYPRNTPLCHEPLQFVHIWISFLRLLVRFAINIGQKINWARQVKLFVVHFDFGCNVHVSSFAWPRESTRNTSERAGAHGVQMDRNFCPRRAIKHVYMNIIFDISLFRLEGKMKFANCLNNVSIYMTDALSFLSEWSVDFSLLLSVAQKRS